MAKYMNLAKQGSWPVAGGVLDQSEKFVSACAAFWHWQGEFQGA